ncbi:hypothetical protein [Bergeyella sp. RCAD1439]|uniref:hypothetical protein n=1 Tax=Bergeyella anatis TaxID=3113737 RepID=UPI002E19F6F0|nr:hypothetical protein [Bergeyella sp. RCAD1439]
MFRSFVYLLVGTLGSYFLNAYVLGSRGFGVDWYYGFAFGLGWALAYFVDRPEWPLVKKMGLSLIGVGVLLGLGFAFFDFEIAVPSVIKFSTVFVAYYLLASFRQSKSLRK